MDTLWTPFLGLDQAIYEKQPLLGVTHGTIYPMRLPHIILSWFCTEFGRRHKRLITIHKSIFSVSYGILMIVQFGVE